MDPDPAFLWDRAQDSPCFGHNHRLVCKLTVPPILISYSEIAGGRRFIVNFDRYGVAISCRRNQMLARGYGPLVAVKMRRQFTESMLYHEINELMGRWEDREIRNFLCFSS